jgi:cytosine/adenosine deaminase-related metal-dependent hydrolase
MTAPDSLSRRQLIKLAAGGGLLAASALASGARGPIHAQKPDTELALEPGWLLRWQDGRALLERGRHVLVRDGRIAAIQDRPLPASIPRLDMGDCLLMPGFISCHNHVASGTPTRGIVELGRSDLRPLLLVEELLDDDEIDALTRFNLAELMLSGCTTQLEMSCTLRQAESYVRVADSFGARGYPGAMLPNITRLMPIIAAQDDRALNEAEPATLAEIAQNLAFARRYAGSADGRITPMLTPMACDFHTPATMRALAAAARELGTGVHTHLAWHAQENATMRRRWNRTSAQWWEDFGFLEGPFFGAHFGYPDWEVDAPILRRHGAIYAHCPAMGGVGGATQPYPEALGHGIRTNVGIDTHSNNYLEMLKLAVVSGQARYHALKGASTLPMAEPTMEEAIRGATLYPAQALRRDDLGRIEEGAQADLVAVDVSGFLVGGGALPPEPLNNLLYASGWSVRHVMTAGVVQVRDRKLEVADSRIVMQQGGEVLRKIWSALGEEGWFDA